MPTRDSSWPAGTPCWVDYAAADIDEARAFYTSVLGWDYTDGKPEFGGYLNALTKGRLVAGLMPRMEPSQPSAWITYFASEDAVATVAAIESAGGRAVAGPHPVGSLGTMVVAVDPQGMVFGVWQAAEHTGVQIYNEPGSLVWNEAATADPEAAQRFYSSVFGFRFDPVDGADGYATFALGETPLGGLGGHTPGCPEGWLVCFSVASADRAAAAVEVGGGKVQTAPMDTPYGRFAVMEDPWGAAFEIMQAAPES